MKLPLEYNFRNNGAYDADSDLVSVIFDGEDADFIVKACNSHELLLEQLKALHDLVIVANVLPSKHTVIIKARAAIKQAESVGGGV